MFLSSDNPLSSEKFFFFSPIAFTLKSQLHKVLLLLILLYHCSQIYTLSSFRSLSTVPFFSISTTLLSPTPNLELCPHKDPLPPESFSPVSAGISRFLIIQLYVMLILHSNLILVFDGFWIPLFRKYLGTSVYQVQCPCILPKCGTGSMPSRELAASACPCVVVS